METGHRKKTFVPGLYTEVLHSGVWNLIVGSLFYLACSDYTDADTLPCLVCSITLLTPNWSRLKVRGLPFIFLCPSALHSICQKVLSVLPLKWLKSLQLSPLWLSSWPQPHGPPVQSVFHGGCKSDILSLSRSLSLVLSWLRCILLVF